jgi:hypothetical protein
MLTCILYTLFFFFLLAQGCESVVSLLSEPKARETEREKKRVCVGGIGICVAAGINHEL